ncbi:MAG: hypothetical protein ACREBG_16685, partial [Pyrinomonadaceae bacterium]
MHYYEVLARCEALFRQFICLSRTTDQHQRTPSRGGDGFEEALHFIYRYTKTLGILATRDEVHVRACEHGLSDAFRLHITRYSYHQD